MRAFGPVLARYEIKPVSTLRQGFHESGDTGCGSLGTRWPKKPRFVPSPWWKSAAVRSSGISSKIYASHGINDFIVCCGYKGWLIKLNIFANYMVHSSDVTVDIRNNHIEFHQSYAEPWRVTLVDTGENTMTGGRAEARRAAPCRRGAVLPDLW